LTDREMAIICASHNGEAIHVEVVRNILAKAGFSEEDLECGSHLPYDRETACQLMASGKAPSALYNNCSGKHAGMLLLCKHLGFPVPGYTQKDHPLQVLMHKTIADLADLPLGDISLGVDGCGVLVFALPIKKAAYLFARLANPASLPRDFQASAQRITRAMINEPYMIAGKGRLCTELMEKTHGKLVAKGGAEGVYCVGVMGRDMGIAIKIEDGNSRAIDPIIMKILKGFQILNQEEQKALAERAHPVIKNHRGEVIGSLETCFPCDKAACIG